MTTPAFRDAAPYDVLVVGPNAAVDTYYSLEALSLSQGYEKLYALIVIYVVLAFLAQAVLGGSLLQSGLLAAWIGWLAILWNIAWLVALPVTSPRDIYFPVLHHVMPLVIGIALLLK